MSPEHSHAGALNPTVSACGGGAFGKELSVDEIMRELLRMELVPF